MLLEVRWDGSETPFEGNRAIPLGVIPIGAQVLAARVTVTPIDPGAATAADLEDSFVERIRFAEPASRWGANIAHGSNFVEVDFRARRTLAAVTASHLGVGGGTLQIDPGGTYVEINSQGAIRTPNDTLFKVTDGRQVLPSFVVARFKVTNTAVGVPDLSEVEIRSVPENVSLRLGDQPPFHTFLGAMTEPETSVDFAPLLTELLRTARVENGLYVVSLVIHSDTIARLDVAVRLEVLQAHEPLAPGLKEAVMEFTVDAIPAGAATSFRLDVPVDAQAVAGRTAVHFQGSFDDTRIALGPLAPELTAGAARMVSTPAVSPRPEAQAQPFVVPGPSLNITGIDLLLTPVTLAAQVQVDIRDDLGGKPGAQTLLAAPLKVDLHRNASASPQWVTVELPAERHLEQGRPLWLVVQRSLGDTEWSVRPAESGQPGLQQTDDGGLSWRKTVVGALAQAEGLFRLRHRPAAFTMPIHVFVGEGPDRQEVPLAQFEPLGRVDFTLDTEEFAAAINRVLAKTAVAHCQSVEHLNNGELEEWFRVGEAPGSPRTMPWEPAEPLAALAMSPDALYFYTLGIEGREATVRRFDAVCLEEREALTLSEISGNVDTEVARGSLAISPSGNQLFGSFGSQIWMMDLRAWAEIGSWMDKRRIVALASGGGRLFVAREGALNVTGGQGALPDIRAFVATAAEAALAAGDVPTSAEVWTLNERPISIAASPSGNRVLAAFPTGDDPDGSLVAYGTAGEEVGKELVRIDTLGFKPTGVALAGQGVRGVVADETNAKIHLVDLSKRTVTAPGLAITVNPSSLGFASITADRLAVSGKRFASDGTDVDVSVDTFIDVIDFGAPVPKHWDITAGQVQPVCLDDPFHVAARLGHAGGGSLGPLSSFSQVVAVTGGCPYAFSFWASASADGAAGEVIWRGDGCTATRIDTVPIRPGGSGIQTRSNAAPTLELHRVLLKAPEGGSQAEVRFRASDGVEATVDRISLKPPDGPLANPDLLLVGNAGLPQGWSLEPAASPGFQFAAGIARNLGIDPLTLLQEVAVTEKTAFRLELQGATTHEADPPRAAVHWLDVVAPPVEMTLDEDGASTRVAEGVVPAGAKKAEVSLTLPGGSSVTLEHFALRVGLMTGVLFSVYAEAPGSLTVSRFQVVTDKVTPTPPPTPDDGLCPSTKPGEEAGCDEGDTHYCPSCGSDQVVGGRREAVLSGRPVTMVRCETCGAGLVRHSGQLMPHRRALVLPSFAIPRPRDAARPDVRGSRPLRRSVAGRPTPPAAAVDEPSALSTIRSLSAAEIHRFTLAGILTLPQLAALDVDALTELLPTRSANRARMLRGIVQKALAVVIR